RRRLCREVARLRQRLHLADATARHRIFWDEIWNRPGLDRRSRSLLNLGMIAALNRPHELKLHVRGALNNGLTREELREVFLQIAAYCGFPAALDALRVATEALAELDAKG